MRDIITLSLQRMQTQELHPDKEQESCTQEKLEVKKVLQVVQETHACTKKQSNIFM
jgi:hypothetical protein